MTVGPATPAVPTRPVPAHWLLALSLCTVGVFAALFGPLQILLAKQAAAFAPENKESVLGVVTGTGAAFSLLANPLFGALSDRTTSRFGKRLPWIAGGTLGGVIALLVLGAAPTVPMMVFGWALAQIALNAPFAAINVSIADQVPIRQRGKASGLIGGAQFVGTVAGTGLAVALGGIVSGYLACAVFLVVAVLPYLMLRRDVVLSPADREPWSWRTFGKGMWVSPRRYPDFAWAWSMRFLVMLANAMTLLYLWYFLSDAVKVVDPDQAIMFSTLVYGPTLMVGVAVGGIWSDRSGKRRVFVIAGGVTMTVAALLLAIAPTWTTVLLASGILGFGFGIYLSVDLALMTQVLPSTKDSGRDLGVINIASSLPQVLAPVVAAPLVTKLGGYTTLYTVCAFIGLAGCVLAYRIRSVP